MIPIFSLLSSEYHLKAHFTKNKIVVFIELTFYLGLLLNAEWSGIIKVIIAEQKLLICGTEITFKLWDKNCLNAEQRLL